MEGRPPLENQGEITWEQPMPQPNLDRYLEENAAQFEGDLCELLRIPSISADSRYRPDVRRAAEWVAAQFGSLGLTAEICETPGHPIVYAESLSAPGARPRWFTATMTCSPPIRWMNGSRPRLNQPCARAIFMPAAPPTTRGKCSRT